MLLLMLVVVWVALLLSVITALLDEKEESERGRAIPVAIKATLTASRTVPDIPIERGVLAIACMSCVLYIEKSGRYARTDFNASQSGQ